MTQQGEGIGTKAGALASVVLETAGYRTYIDYALIAIGIAATLFAFIYLMLV